MLKISILKTEFYSHRVVGKAGTVFEQKAYIHLDGEPYPKEIRVSKWADRNTGEEPRPYAKGEYVLSPESFSIGKYADLVCRPVLVPLASKSA